MSIPVAPVRRAISSLGLLLAVGCEVDGDDDRGYGDCGYDVCDIEKPKCAKRAAEAVACELGLDAVTVPEIRFLTAAEVIDEVEAEADPMSADEIRNLEDLYRAEALLGHMPEGYAYEDADTNFVNWAVAYYDRETEAVTIIVDNISDDPVRAYRTLVHELVHAYQDSTRGLDAFYDAHATSFDRWLGARATTEGEARLIDTLADLALAGYRPEQIDWDGYYGEYQVNVLEGAAESDVPSLDVTAFFPYAFGAAMLHEAWMTDGLAGIDAIYADPPDSVVQVMDWGGGQTDEVWNLDAQLDAHAFPELDEDRYTILAGRHASAWMVNVTLRRTGGGKSALWNPEADDVRSDFLTYVRDEQSGDLAVFWRIQTDDAASLVHRLGRPPGRWGNVPSHVVVEFEGDVLLVATTGTEAQPWLDAVRDWAPLDAPRRSGTAFVDLTRTPRRVF